MARRWEAVAATFVDDPHKAVEEADALLGEVVQRIADERGRLRQRWSGPATPATEELRLLLQHYRDLLQALSRRPTV
jgi:hypothetical protein